MSVTAVSCPRVSRSNSRAALQKVTPNRLWIVGLALLAVTIMTADASAVSYRLRLDVAGIAAGDQLGTGASTVGDINGDGYDDFLFGAPLRDDGTTNDGAAYLYLGGLDFQVSSAITLSAQTNGEYFGGSSAPLGDFNGDGHDDFVVGAHNGDVSVGRAYVYFGGPGFDTTPDMTFAGQGINSFYGEFVASAGDINGDGAPDLIVGARTYNGSTGRAYVYYGGAFADTTVDLILDGEAASDEFGIEVAGAGDVNGDGYDDVIVGARYNDAGAGNAGRAYIFFGGDSPDVTADVVLQRDVGAWFGYSVAGVGDVNADGYTDVLVGAPQDPAGGNALLYFGGATMDTIPDIVMSGVAILDFMGEGVAGGFDLNADGYPDWLVSAVGWDFPDGNAGRVFAYFGGPGLDGTPDIVLSGQGLNNEFGRRVATAGDVNGDGNDDILVGSPFHFGTDQGKGFLYLVYAFEIFAPNGGEELVAGTQATIKWRGSDPADLAISHDAGATWATLASGIGGASVNDHTFIVPGPATHDALLRLSYTGLPVSESTSDRTDDLFRIVEPHDPPAAVHPLKFTVTGAASDGLGVEASAAGDFNGDGADDFIVSGVIGEKAWIVFGGPNADNVPDLTLNAEVSGDEFGSSVGGGADFNGDGYPDVIVGASRNDAGGAEAGRAYVFYGGPGADATPDVTFTAPSAGDRLGNAASLSGDVNGDGYADALVGAVEGGASNEGQAFLYLGGASPDNVADLTLTGEATDNDFGRDVAIVGDVNGDGFDDFAVTGPKNDAGGTDAGRIYVYFGGLVLDGTADIVMTGEFGGDALGQALAGAGDVNGDGYDDVVATSTGNDGGGASAGRAYVYYGGANPNGDADWVIDGEGAGNFLGTAADGAGDVNQDGFADIVVTAQLYNGAIGRAYIHYGGPGADGVPDVIMDGEATSDIFGSSVAGVGDFDGDGFDDVVVGARLNDAGGGASGRAYLYDSQRYDLTSPAGGETWNVGGTHSVSWLGETQADVWLSVDGGASFDLLRANVGGQTSNHLDVLVPHVPTRFAVVKVAPSDLSVTGDDRNDSLFTIEASVSLLTFTVTAREGGGAELDWSTDPVVSPDGISGYRLYRIPAGMAGLGQRIGPQLIANTHYSDRDGAAGSVYRLTAVNGLGQELELGRQQLALVAPLAAWPQPYREGVLSISFAASSALGGGPGETSLTIFDAAGRRVRTLTSGRFAPGFHSTTWDGRDGDNRRVPQGIYFLRLVSEQQSRQMKLVVLP